MKVNERIKETREVIEIKIYKEENNQIHFYKMEVPKKYLNDYKTKLSKKFEREGIRYNVIYEVKNKCNGYRIFHLCGDRTCKLTNVKYAN